MNYSSILQAAEMRPPAQLRSLAIFISHPSDLLTDCQPHGDGLVAFEFIHHLAKQGHRLYIAADQVDIQQPLPENIKVYPAQISTPNPILRRLFYLIHVRKTFEQIHRVTPIDIIHQLNPVVPGLSLSLLGTPPPVVLGPIVAWWAVDAFQPKATSRFQQLGQSLKTGLRQMIAGLHQRQASALLIATPAALNKIGHPESVQHKLFDLRHGVDAVSFMPLETPLPHIPTILFVGHISYHKGIFTLLKAFETVAATMPVKLVIAGGWDDQSEAVQQTIAQMRFGDQVSVLGRVSRAEMPALLRSCTLYCMPSYGEPFGMGTLEAMACGKPIVGTDANGLGYLISDEGGRKVPPKDAAALAAALIEVLKSPSLQVSMGHQNRKLVEARYAWDKTIQQLEAVYAQIL
jgi:L-malate glycosyltransferase